MSWLSFLVVYAVACASTTADAASVPQQDCGEIFQSKLLDFLAVKESCHSSFYENCRQVIAKDL